jgi:hypothetical protein
MSAVCLCGRLGVLELREPLEHPNSRGRLDQQRHRLLLSLTTKQQRHRLSNKTGRLCETDGFMREKPMHARK